MYVDYKYRKYFADYVSRCMEERDIRPWYVAYYSELQDSTFRKCLKSARLPNPINLIMIAELFECSVNDLLGCERITIEPREHIFDSGLDSRHVGEYFNTQLKRLMRDKDMSSNELAAICECSEYTVMKYINEYVIPDTSMMLKICSALDCTPSELLGY